MDIVDGRFWTHMGDGFATGLSSDFPCLFTLRFEGFSIEHDSVTAAKRLWLGR